MPKRSGETSIRTGARRRSSALRPAPQRSAASAVLLRQRRVGSTAAAARGTAGTGLPKRARFDAVPEAAREERGHAAATRRAPGRAARGARRQRRPRARSAAPCTSRPRPGPRRAPPRPRAFLGARSACAAPSVIAREEEVLLRGGGEVRDDRAREPDEERGAPRARLEARAVGESREEERAEDELERGEEAEAVRAELHREREEHLLREREDGEREVGPDSATLRVSAMRRAIGSGYARLSESVTGASAESAATPTRSAAGPGRERRPAAGDEARRAARRRRRGATCRAHERGSTPTARARPGRTARARRRPASARQREEERDHAEAGGDARRALARAVGKDAPRARGALRA